MANRNKKTSERPEPPLRTAPMQALAVGQWNLNTVMLRLVGGYLALTLLASALLYWGGTAEGNELTVDRSIFSAINAITLTGFQGAIGINTYLPAAKLLVIFLTMIGAVFCMAAGGLAVVRIVRLPYTDEQVMRSAVAFCVFLSLAGAVPLIPERGPRDALMLSASALANSGLFFADLPGATSWETQTVLLPLAVLGGLGLPVLMELWDVVRLRGRTSFYGRTVLQMTAALYLLGLILCILARWANLEESPTTGGEWMQIIGSSSVASINSRTAGFPFEFAQEFPRTMQVLLILFMMIGGSTAGTAGGLKTTTIVEVGRGWRRILRGASPGRGFGLALLWIAAYAAVALGCFVVLLWTEPQLLSDRLLFETVSATSNVGLSYDTVMIVGSGLNVLSVAMLAGRLLPILLLWLMAQTTRDADLPIG